MLHSTQRNLTENEPMKSKAHLERLERQSKQDAADLLKALEERDEARNEVEILKKGEYICRKCGLRKDGEHDEKGDF